MKKLPLIIFLALFSCKTEPKFEKVKVENKYSVELPNNMKRAADLNEDASLQYSDPLKEVYVIVLDEPRTDTTNGSMTIDRYFELASKGIEYGVEEGKLMSPKKEKINGLTAVVSDITGKFEGQEIWYKLAVVEGKSNYYQILSWTIGKNKEEFSDEMEKMIHSFKEER